MKSLSDALMHIPDFKTEPGEKIETIQEYQARVAANMVDPAMEELKEQLNDAIAEELQQTEDIIQQIDSGEFIPEDRRFPFPDSFDANGNGIFLRGEVPNRHEQVRNIVDVVEQEDDDNIFMPGYGY